MSMKPEDWIKLYKDKLQLIAEINRDTDPNRAATTGGSGGNYSDQGSSTDSPTPIVTDGQTITTPYVTIAIPKIIPNAEIKGGKVIPPSIDRKLHQKYLYAYRSLMQPSGYGKLGTDKFSFEYLEENQFMPHFIPILNTIHKAVTPLLGVQKLYINSGLRNKPEQNDKDGKPDIDGHMAGIAVDIRASGQDRYTIADACWGIGLRAIAIGNSFVHVDAGPEAHWGYGDIPVYRGAKA